jgi:hypothetical protein
MSEISCAVASQCASSGSCELLSPVPVARMPSLDLSAASFVTRFVVRRTLTSDMSAIMEPLMPCFSASHYARPLHPAPSTAPSRAGRHTSAARRLSVPTTYNLCVQHTTGASTGFMDKESARFFNLANFLMAYSRLLGAAGSSRSPTSAADGFGVQRSAQCTIRSAQLHYHPPGKVL